MQPARASDTKVLWVCRFAVSLQSERQSFKEIISQTECSWGWALEWENLRRHPRHWEDYSRWIECGSGMTLLHDAIVLWYISELRVQPKHPSDIFKPRDGGTVKTGESVFEAPSIERQGSVEKSRPWKTEAKTDMVFAIAIMWPPLHSFDFVLCVWKDFHSARSSGILSAESYPQIVARCIETSRCMTGDGGWSG